MTKGDWRGRCESVRRVLRDQGPAGLRECISDCSEVALLPAASVAELFETVELEDLPANLVPIHHSILLKRPPSRTDQSEANVSHSGILELATEIGGWTVIWRVALINGPLRSPRSGIVVGDVDSRSASPFHIAAVASSEESTEWLGSIDVGAVRTFCGVVGDPNPVHLEFESAREAGLPGLVAPGSLVATLLLSCLECQAVDFDSCSVRFKQWLPVPCDIGIRSSRRGLTLVSEQGIHAICRARSNAASAMFGGAWRE